MKIDGLTGLGRIIFIQLGLDLVHELGHFR